MLVTCIRRVRLSPIIAADLNSDERRLETGEQSVTVQWGLLFSLIVSWVGNLAISLL